MLTAPPSPSMPTILERPGSGLALILWRDGSVDVLTIGEASELLAQLELCAFAADCRAEW